MYHADPPHPPPILDMYGAWCIIKVIINEETVKCYSSVVVKCKF